MIILKKLITLNKYSNKFIIDKDDRKIQNKSL